MDCALTWPVRISTVFQRPLTKPPCTPGLAHSPCGKQMPVIRAAQGRPWKSLCSASQGEMANGQRVEVSELMEFGNTGADCERYDYERLFLGMLHSIWMNRQLQRAMELRKWTRRESIRWLGQINDLVSIAGDHVELNNTMTIFKSNLTD